ncbi:hypothetical protein [Sphingomonas cavernae]|uniref:Uncharacterized protein n=1 Tax=Sphingomonas cavernae TaxID=2320861 RepID=A0A418WNL2_9SPHN|nr:hypothetical protein [Sphingomonas cavernae]RJF91592.1 hypothetical protein D3876_13675 [Sphingomonas cavernae]RJF91594.1 hypothetical protein D3876_13690 [Sphingomonas cavernae]
MTRLPTGFEVLEPFVENWALEGSANRANRRSTSTEAERSAFFEAGKPLLVPALALLDAKPLAEYDAGEQRLMNLCLSLAHIAQAVEVQGSDEASHTPHREAMRITRAPADV